MGIWDTLVDIGNWIWDQVEEYAPEVAEAVTNTVNTLAHIIVGGEQNNNSQSDTPAQPTGPTPEELYQQKIDKKARQFDNDISQKMRLGFEEDTYFSDEYPSDNLVGSPASMADMLLLAGQNSIVYDLLQMMRNEQQTLNIVMQHANSTLDGLRLLFTDANHNEEAAIEAARAWDESQATRSAALYLNTMSEVDLPHDISSRDLSRMPADFVLDVLGDSLEKMEAQGVDSDELEEVYMYYIRNIYGITIEQEADAPEITLEALRNYQEGAEEMAQLFEQTLESYVIPTRELLPLRPNGPRPFPDLDFIPPISRMDVDRYELFRAIMGDMTIARGSRQWVEEQTGKDTKNAWGYTAGHTIYDIFDSESRSPMSGNLFVHELTHSFLTSSGLGNWNNSPLVSDPIANSIALITLGAIDTTLIPPGSQANAIADDILQQFGFVIRKDIDPPTIRQSTDDSSNEVWPDVVMADAWGLFNTAGVDLDYQDAMLMSMRNAALYNAPLEQQVDIYQEHGFASQDFGTVTSVKDGTPVRRGSVSGPEISGTRERENYPVFAASQNTDDLTFIGTLYNGQKVWIYADAFGFPSLPDDIPSEFEFSFDSNTDLRGLPLFDVLSEILP